MLSKSIREAIQRLSVSRNDNTLFIRSKTNASTAITGEIIAFEAILASAWVHVKTSNSEIVINARNIGGQILVIKIEKSVAKNKTTEKLFSLEEAEVFVALLDALALINQSREESDFEVLKQLEEEFTSLTNS